MAEIVLETQALTKQFKSSTVVNNVNLKIYQGDVYGFLGPNGAGKSTTMRMLVGLLKPNVGEVQLFGEAVNPWNPHILRRVGVMIENPVFYEYLSGYQNLRMLTDLSGGCTSDKIRETLKLVQLDGRAQDKVRTYSQGMKRRLGIAAALLPDPELILLDEPTDTLDPAGIRDIRNLILKLAKEEKKTFFLSSHVLSEIQQVCNRVTVLSRGKQIYEGNVDALLGADEHYRLWADPESVAREVITEMTSGKIEKDPSHEGRLKIMDPQLKPDVLVEKLLQAGCRVMEIVKEKPQLEESFLKLVESENRTSGGA